MSAHDADELLERARRALDRDLPTVDEVLAELAAALDEIEREFPNGDPGPDGSGREGLRYQTLVSRISNRRWKLENGQAVEFPRGRRSRLERDESGESWEEFLAEHPELSGEGRSKPQPARASPLVFTDAELLKALRQACRAWGRRFPKRRSTGVLSSSVAWTLAGVSELDGRSNLAPELRPSTRDVIRVGVALARLAREGRVERTNKRWEMNQWAPRKRGHDAR